MPEIAEVARIVHYLKQYLVGRVISKVVANEDTIVFKDTSSNAFETAMKGNKAVDARQQGKYFWLVMEKSPHPLMHFGMTGWIVFKKAPEAHYRADAEEDNSKLVEEWPPRFTKFLIETDEPGNEIAFIDPRRLGRIRLIDEPSGDIRKLSPLKENGPDPVVDGFEEKWFKEQLSRRKKPIKALLLDQAFISGVGNWVGDEILYHARIHPEQYSNALTPAQQTQLYDSTMYVCKTAVEAKGESSKFPEDWIFLHRWGKGKKNANVLPNGEKLDFVKVGGRTSAYVKSRQKATGHTTVGEPEEVNDGNVESQSKGKASKKRKGIKEEEEAESVAPKKKGKKAIKEEEEEEQVKLEPVEDEKPKKGTGKAVKKEEKEVKKEEKAVLTGKKVAAAVKSAAEDVVSLGRRRSQRGKK